MSPVEPPVTGLKALRDDIESELRTNPRMKGVQGWLDGVTGGEAAVTDADNRLIPYWVLTWGGRMRTSAQGIVGSKKDLRRLLFGVEVYAKDANEVQRVEDDIYDVLEEYQPVNGGPISYQFSGRIENPIDFKTNHTRDGRGMIFELYAGTITPDDPVV